LNVDLPDWAECLFDESLRYIGLRGGRGSGKSRSIATALVVRGKDKPLRILCGREIQKSIKDSVKRLLDDSIKRCGLQDHYESTDTEIRGKNGTLFIFSGLRSNIDSVKSIEGIDIFWGEESQTFSKLSLETLKPTIRKTGSQLIFSWNPRFADDPIEDLLVINEPPPRSKILLVNHDQNPWFPIELQEEMEADKARNFETYLWIWQGHYSKNSEKRIYKNWRVEKFDTPKDTFFYFGLDFGFSQDPTVLIRCFIEGRKLFIDHEAYEIGCETVDMPYMIMTIEESENWPITGDSSRPETISHLRRNGIPKVRPSIKGPNSVEEGIKFLQGYDIIVHERCVGIIDNLTTYSYKVNPKTDEVTTLIDHKGSDGCDALRYAIELVRRTSKKKKTTIVQANTVSRWS
tara:strand:- start:334 stop:1545 length:1212 start_codon:yes stop_codon:yes gene_type:complete